MYHVYACIRVYINHHPRTFCCTPKKSLHEIRPFENIHSISTGPIVLIRRLGNVFLSPTVSSH